MTTTPDRSTCPAFSAFTGREVDHGTPARDGADVERLTIDGVPVSVPRGTSILRAAVLAGIQIPKLCATESLEPFGSCRLCLVEIEGRKGTPASCTTLVEPGMAVHTQSPRLAALRRNVMELYISDHPLDCLTCPANGACELQDMAGVVGLRSVRYGFAGENHLQAEKDESNPYFSFDSSKCIVCSRCVRACEETQGTFALTISGRGFGSRVSPGQDERFLASECVSCGACVKACPTATLTEKTIIELGQPEHEVVTTCAYCGVGCGFKAQMKGNQVVNMVPWNDGKANEGHSCVKGRFAWGYATHPDRILKPLIRERTSDPWREVDWDEAIAFAAEGFRRVQAKYGRDAVGGISSSRCTNEETWLVQKLVRTAFGNNNIDTCARVCHSPTGYGLGQAYGTSAGTQTFESVEAADVIVVIGANPTEAHPVFASRMKRRLRAGARLIVIDPRAIDLVRGPHVRADFHLALRPGTNVAVISAMAHVIATEGLVDEAFVAERCDLASFRVWREWVSRPENSPEALSGACGVPAADLRAAARLYATGGNAAIYYGLGVTEHAQGSTMVMGIANLAMATGNIGRPGVGVNPLRGQNNVQGACDMGSFPHELPGYRHVSDATVRASFDAAWGVQLQAEPGLRIPNMFDAALDGSFKGLYVPGRGFRPVGPEHAARHGGHGGDGARRRPGHLPERDRAVRPRLPARLVLPREGRHLHQRRAADLPRAPGHAAALRQGRLGDHLRARERARLPMDYAHPSEIMQEIARLTPSFAGVSYAKLDRLGSVQWPCTTTTGEAGTPIMHVGGFVRGKGRFLITQLRRDRREGHAPLPAAADDRPRALAVQRRRPDPADANRTWYPEDVLEIHPHDAAERGVADHD
jgi:formate dehydrogenase major subunit